MQIVSWLILNLFGLFAHEQKPQVANWKKPVESVRVNLKIQKLFTTNRPPAREKPLNQTKQLFREWVRVKICISQFLYPKLLYIIRRVPFD